MLKKTSEGSKAFEKILNNPLLKRHREKIACYWLHFCFIYFFFFEYNVLMHFFTEHLFLLVIGLKKDYFVLIRLKISI